MAPDAEGELDYRFSLANERTFLAWIRTAIGLLAAGILAAKALNFQHDAVRWIVSVPPIVAGVATAVDAFARWRGYETAMRTGRRLPAGRGLKILAFGMAAYGVVLLVALLIDG
ncbi:MAG: YidH family protein [Solirubrobacteraceae bacterium]